MRRLRNAITGIIFIVAGFAWHANSYHKHDHQLLMGDTIASIVLALTGIYLLVKGIRGK